MVAQKIVKAFTPMEKAIAYFRIISALNDLHLSDREVQLLAFMAVRGTISNPAAREDFCKMYSTTKATVGNLLSRLRRAKLIFSEGKRVKLLPALSQDFTQEMILHIKLPTNAV